MISVVIPVKDAGEDLARCMDGMRSQVIDDELLEALNDVSAPGPIP